MYFGHHPNGHIDHINHDRTDNRIINLRDVSQQENNRNLPLLKTNKSGVAGVCLSSQNGKWRAFIKNNGRHEYIGQFTTKQEAISARHVRERELGFHPNHGLRVTAGSWADLIEEIDAAEDELEGVGG